MKNRNIILYITAIFLILAGWMAAIFLYTIFPSFSLSNLKNAQAGDYPEITNIAPEFLPLGNDEKRLIANGNNIIAAIEKYFLENGDYPTSLKVLVSNYIAKIPKTGYKQTYLLSLKIENAKYRYHAALLKDEPDRPELAGFFISVRYGMFDEWYYNSDRKVWEWANH